VIPAPNGCGCLLHQGSYAWKHCTKGHDETHPPPEIVAGTSAAQQARTPRPFRSVAAEPEEAGRADAPRFGRHRLNVDTGQVERVTDAGE
jgi:hypothetical protein